MLKKLTILIFILSITIISNSVSAQALTGIKTINAQGSGTNNYVSLKSAIDSLNKYGVGIGGVIFNISANHVEQAPVKGYQVWRSGDANKKIIFQKSGIGENPVFTAYKGLSTFKSIEPDGIFNIIGSDYVELNGLTFKENINNVTSADLMEYGIGVFMADTDDISHHINIKNCKIELSRNNVSNVNENSVVKGSAGLLIIAKPYTYLTYNKIRKFEDANLIISSNEISNANTGIEVNGKLNGIEISNNKIKDFGNNIFSSIVSQGISVNNAKNYKIINNEIISDYYNSTIFSEIKKSIGIKLNNEIETPSNDLVENNYIKMVSNNNTNHLIGIEAIKLDTLKIMNNTIDSLSIYSNDSTSIIAIDINKSKNVFIQANTIKNQNYYTPTSGKSSIFNIRAEYCNTIRVNNNNIKFTNTKNKLYNRDTSANIYIDHCSDVSILKNEIELFKTSTQDIYKYYGIYSSYNITSRIDSNNITSNNNSKHYSINSDAIFSKDYEIKISNNLLENIYSYKDLKVINCEQISKKNTVEISNNIIRNIFTNYGTLNAIRNYKCNARIHSNKIYNINIIDYSASLDVVKIDANFKTKFYNNAISNINALFSINAGTGDFLATGLHVKSSNIPNTLIEIYNNTIQLKVNSTSSNCISACIYHDADNSIHSKEELYLYNNILTNYSSINANNTRGSANIIYSNISTKFYTINKLSNNNIYYLGTAKLRRYFYSDQSSSYLNFDTYKAFANPIDNKSKHTSINFIDPDIADFRIADSSISYAESNGKFNAELLFDIIGKKRPGFSYSKNKSGYGIDIGAFEFDGIDTNKTDNKSPIVFLDESTTYIDGCNDSSHIFKLNAFDQSKITNVNLLWRPDSINTYIIKPFERISDSSFKLKLDIISHNIIYFFEVIDSLNNKTTSNIYTFSSNKTVYKYLNNEIYHRLGDTLKHTIETDAITTIGTKANAVLNVNDSYSSYFEGNSNSYLYTAEELKAAGLNKGYIKSMMFKNFNQAKGVNLIIDWFKISIASTSKNIIEIDSSLNYQTSYEIDDYWPVKGENKHIFQTPYYWDGVSNIVIKICALTNELDNYQWLSEYINANDSTAIRSNAISSQTDFCDFQFGTYYINKKPLIYLQNNLIPAYIHWYSNDQNANIIQANKIELIAKPLSNGVYNYIRETIFNNCRRFDTLKVYVNNFQLLNLEDTVYVCENNLKEFDAKNNGYNYYWFLNNQLISNNQKVYVNTPGKYYIVITDNLGHSYTDSSYLLNYNVDNVNLGIDTQICRFGPYTINSNVSADKYLWSNGDTTKMTALYNTQLITLKVKYQNGCESQDSKYANFDGIVSLSPRYFYYPDTVYKYFAASNNSEDFTYYEWNMDDPLSTENIKTGHYIKHKFISPKNQFNITVKAYRYGFSCVYNDTLIFQLVGINELKSKFDINVYPNPIENNTTINYRLNENDNLVSIKVFDVLGRETTNIINNENQSAGNYQYNLNEIKSLAKGIYLLNININGQTFSQKLIND